VFETFFLTARTQLFDATQGGECNVSYILKARGRRSFAGSENLTTNLDGHPKLASDGLKLGQRTGRHISSVRPTGALPPSPDRAPFCPSILSNLNPAHSDQCGPFGVPD
jgi:hypothetical protein